MKGQRKWCRVLVVVFRVFIVPCFFFLSFGKPRDPFASSAERECVFARGACSLRRDFGRRGGLLRRPLFFGRRESPRRRTSSSSSARRERDGEGFFSRFFPSGKTTTPQTGEREREIAISSSLFRCVVETSSPCVAVRRQSRNLERKKTKGEREE